jgi:uncharacterized protein (UPF0548 family)
MYSLNRPDTEEIDRLICECRRQSAFQTTGDVPRLAPPGHWLNHGAGEVGAGPAAFAAAREALRQWEMFPAWVSVNAQGLPAEVGCIAATTARCLGVWTTNCCRVVEVTDREDCFTFTYATVASHAVRGAERFAVTWNRATDVVSYEVHSIARPADLVVWLAFPWFRRIQRRFASDSPRALRESVNRRLSDRSTE